MNNLEIILVLLFLILDLVTTAARTGLLNIHYARLLTLSERDEEDVSDIVGLLTSRVALRSSLKFTQNLLRVLIAGILLTMAAPWNSSEYSTLTLIGELILITIVIWIVESLIELIVLRDPETWANQLTPYARAIVFILSPLLSIPARFAGPPQQENDQLVNVTEDELKTIVDASEQAGVIESDESEMIQSIFDFGDTLAREIMVPRIDMLTLEVNTPLEEAADAVLESGFSRVPVYEERIDNILGVLYTKDMLTVWRGGNGENSLRQLLRSANFIPETKKVDDLLEEMQKARNHIAIVVDEYGGVAGLVTLEDIVEEIFGEIQDEYDDGEELPHQRISEGEYLFLGRIELDEFNEIMGCDLQSNGADTLGGLIYSRLGKAPKIGEKIIEGDLQLIVEQVGRHRVQKVRALIDKRING